VAIQDLQHYVADDQLVDVDLTGAGGRSERWRIPEALFTRDEREMG